MVVHFITKGDRMLASSRQRAYVVADLLRSLSGIETKTYQDLALDTISAAALKQKLKKVLTLAGVLFCVTQDDIIYVHKGATNKYFLALLFVSRIFLRKKIFVDFDDAIFLHSPKKTRLLLFLASRVVVGSHYLKRWAEKYHSQVTIVPTSIHYTLYSKQTKDYTQIEQHDKRINIGWVGNGPAHLGNLRHLPEIFFKLKSTCSNFRFTLVGAVGDERIYSLFSDTPQVQLVDSLNWSDPSNVARMIQNFDIGIMPLEDSEWTKGKCAFKAIEYMACAVPVVCSSVGENVYLIENGANGLLVDDWEKWPATLSALCKSSKLRENLGKAGQHTVRKNYSYEANVPRLASLLTS